MKSPFLYCIYLLLAHCDLNIGFSQRNPPAAESHRVMHQSPSGLGAKTKSCLIVFSLDDCRAVHSFDLSTCADFENNIGADM